MANEYYDKENGVNIRYTNGDLRGEVNTNKFINTLDYSLELIKLREVYEKKYRNKRFSFEKDSHEYCNRVINVTYKYSVKTYNKVGKNLYLKIGTNIKDVVLNDCVYIKDGELLAIKTDESVVSPVKNEVLGKYFYFDDGKYYSKNNITTEVSTKELRDYTYKNGFECDGIKFVRYKRSSGSARVGKCLFIDEKLYPMMHKWELCGLKIKNGQSIDLAAFESYISLTLSSIIDTIQIKPENILLIDDYESIFEDDVMETTIANNELVTKPNRIKIVNSIWDGQSLMDKSAFGIYQNKGMLLLRNRFFKSCCFNCNLQQWFKDNGITDVSQLNGRTRAKRIEDVKLITTPSSIKYLKFGSYDDWLDNLESLFGVVKYEKPTHFLGGEMVQTHYQLLNSLQMTENDVDEFLKPMFDYLDLIKTEPAVLRHHIKYSYQEFKYEPLETNNDIVYQMMGITDEFSKTKLYHKFKKRLIDSMIDDLRCGRVMVKGNYSVLAGNVIEMLQQSIGTFKGVSILGAGNVSSSKFEYNRLLLGSRSPHITMSNVWLPNNVKCSLIDTYMNRTEGIIYINSIKENVLQKLSGSDF